MNFDAPGISLSAPSRIHLCTVYKGIRRLIDRNFLKSRLHRFVVWSRVSFKFIRGSKNVNRVIGFYSRQAFRSGVIQPQLVALHHQRFCRPVWIFLSLSNQLHLYIYVLPGKQRIRDQVIQASTVVQITPHTENDFIFFSYTFGTRWKV